MSSPGQPSLLRVLISPNDPKGNEAHLCWSHSVASRRCMQIFISNQICNHAKQNPGYNYLKYSLVPMSWAFSEGDYENYRSVTRCHLKSSGWNRSDELDTVSFSTRLDMISSSWSWLKKSIWMQQTDVWLSLLLWHINTQAPELESSALLFSDSPKSTWKTVMSVSDFFIVFLKGEWIVASKKNMEFAGTTRVAEADDGPIIENCIRPVPMILA